MLVRLLALAIVVVSLTACGRAPSSSSSAPDVGGRDAAPDVADDGEGTSSSDASAFVDTGVADAGDGEAETDPWDGALLRLLAGCDPGAPHCGVYVPDGGEPISLTCECSFTQPGCVCTFECADAGAPSCPYWRADAGGAACSPWCVPD